MNIRWFQPVKTCLFLLLHLGISGTVWAGDAPDMNALARGYFKSGRLSDAQLIVHALFKDPNQASYDRKLWELVSYFNSEGRTANDRDTLIKQLGEEIEQARTNYNDSVRARAQGAAKAREARAFIVGATAGAVLSQFRFIRSVWKGIDELPTDFEALSLTRGVPQTGQLRLLSPGDLPAGTRFATFLPPATPLNAPGLAQLAIAPSLGRAVVGAIVGGTFVMYGSDHEVVGFRSFKMLQKGPGERINTLSSTTPLDLQ